MTLAADRIALGQRLADVSLALETGTITAICGPNGAGKSSLLEALAGLLEVDRGTVALDGADLRDMPARDRAQRVGYLPQAHEIAWDVPVRSLVELGRMPHGDRRAGPVDAALEALDIADLAERRAQSLSGGETARVLLRAGADVNVLNSEGKSALALVAAVGCSEGAQRLLQARASVQPAGSMRVSPLMIASQLGHAGVVHALLEHGDAAQMNAQDATGVSALMLAAQLRPARLELAIS